MLTEGASVLKVARWFRNLLVAKVAGAESRLIAAGGEERRRLAASAGRFSEEDLTRYVQLILNLYRDLQHAAQPRFHLELGLVKLVHAGRLVSIEEALAGGTPAAPAAPAPASPRPGPAPDPVRTAASGGLRERLLDALRAQGDAFTADAVEQSRLDESPGEVAFHAPADQQYTLESSAASLAAKPSGHRECFGLLVGTLNSTRH